MTTETLHALPEGLQLSDVQIADGLHLAALTDDEYESVMLFLNHSCEPNIGFGGNIVLVAMHANDPSRHGPAGGLENFNGSMDVLTTLTVVAAVLIGATLGTGDLSARVFRELVVTGRSRLSLYAARIPAGLTVLLAPVAVAFGVTAAASRARWTSRAATRGGPGLPTSPGRSRPCSRTRRTRS